MCIRDSCTEREVSSIRSSELEAIRTISAFWAPVSYTHLDVYKRQEMSRVKDMMIIGEKINGSIPSTAKAIASLDENYIRDLARKQAGACLLYTSRCV